MTEYQRIRWIKLIRAFWTKYFSIMDILYENVANFKKGVSFVDRYC